MFREKVILDARKSITPARRKRVLDRFGGKCARLDCDATTGLQLDHIIALALGGKDSDENLEPLCGPHHLVKTQRDVRMIAKAKRIEARENGTRRERKKIASRGFDTRFRKKMNGQVEERK